MRLCLDDMIDLAERVLAGTGGLDQSGFMVNQLTYELPCVTSRRSARPPSNPQSPRLVEQDTKQAAHIQIHAVGHAGDTEGHKKH